MQIIDALLGTKSVNQEQQAVHAGEVFALWQHLVQRYDIRELTDIFQNFAKDIEFKVILTLGVNMINNEISTLEYEMNKLSIPLPPRPPKSINTPSNTEILRDELMYRIVFSGIQNFVVQQTNSILQMHNERLRDIFIDLGRKEIDIYKKMSSYGTLKGWQSVPPAYAH